jgi:hypothetical protein
MPNPVTVNVTTTCTATVTGNGGGPAPTGTISFDNDGASGTFAGNPCTLAATNMSQSQCSLGYVPSGAGTQTITGSYTPSGSTYGSSFGSTTLTVVGCQDPAAAYNRGFNAGFNSGFNAGYRARHDG